MKKQNTNQNNATMMADFITAREAFLDAYELTENQLDELDAITDGDFDALNSFINRIEKLMAIEMPQKTKAVKLSELTFDAVTVGGIVKFHYTKKAIKAMAKNNITCYVAFSDDKVIPADKMPEYDDAIITEINGGNITAISKNSGIEYCLIKDDFDGIINGVQHATYKNCMFGILPFTYKAPASITA